MSKCMWSTETARSSLATDEAGFLSRCASSTTMYAQLICLKPSEKSSRNVSYDTTSTSNLSGAYVSAPISGHLG